ncbi:MAG: hypothetical protein ACRBHB_18065 [Arenicella sp.]
MQTVTITTDIDSLPKALHNFVDQVPFAISNSLNDIAFNIKRDIQETGYGNQITIRDKRQSRFTTRVSKSNKNTLKAEVGSTAWYMDSLVKGGTRRARIGIKHKGKSYLLKPSEEHLKKNGKLKKGVMSGGRIFIFKRNNNMFLANKKGKKLIVVGLLEPKFVYKKQLNIPRHVDPIINKQWPGTVARQMVRAARHAR